MTFGGCGELYCDLASMNKSAFNSRLRKVKNRIFGFLQAKHGIVQKSGVSHKEMIRQFLALTGLSLKKGLRLNHALIELLDSEEFKPYLAYKRKRRPKPPKPYKNWKQAYNAYIASHAWKKKRGEALDLYGRVCAFCGTTEHLHVHHKTYDTLFNEDLAHLMILCKSCHKKIHQ